VQFERPTETAKRRQEGKGEINDGESCIDRSTDSADLGRTLKEEWGSIHERAPDQIFLKTH